MRAEYIFLFNLEMSKWLIIGLLHAYVLNSCPTSHEELHETKVEKT